MQGIRQNNEQWVQSNHFQLLGGYNFLLWTNKHTAFSFATDYLDSDIMIHAIQYFQIATRHVI